MPEQLPLLDSTRRPAPAAPFQVTSPTSKDAAREASKFIGQQGERVHAWWAARGAWGATQKECAADTGIGRPRFARA